MPHDPDFFSIRKSPPTDHDSQSFSNRAPFVDRTIVNNFLPKTAGKILLLVGVAGAMPALAVAQQVSPMSRQQERSKRLESPTAVVKAKEAELINEVLEPELIFPIDLSQSKVVRTRVPVERIAVTDPSIVELTEFNETEFELLGLKAGETTLTIWFSPGVADVPSPQVAQRKGDRIARNVTAERRDPSASSSQRTLRYLVRVDRDQDQQRRSADEIGKLERQINELFPNSQVQLIVAADKLIVRGQARDAKEATDILALLGSQGGRSQGGGQSAVAAGQAAAPVNQAGRAQGNDLQRFSVVNLLYVPGEQQVVLKVRIAELTRSAARSLSMDLKLGDAFSFASGGGNVSAILNGGDMELFLKAFSTNGYGKLLAEPTLVTLSGQTATFLAGGEFAVPTTVGVSGVGAVSTTFRGFGAQLSFTPTVIDKDKIRLQVSPTFSTLSGASVNNIPSLNTRSVNTTVDLREGQWLAIAGLIQDEQGGSRKRFPFLGDVPVVGAIFGTSIAKSRNETELVVLVSPELVHPLEADEVPPLLPGMSVTEPTDEAFYFLQHIEGHPSIHHRSTVWPQYKQQVQADKWVQKHLQQKVSPGYSEPQPQYYFHGPHGLSQ